MSPQSSRPPRRGNRRVTAPGTSGQSEEQEAAAADLLRCHDAAQNEDEPDEARARWLKGERPPHW